MQTREIIARRLVIIIENDTIGDGQWEPMVKQTLQEYIDLIEDGPWIKTVDRKPYGDDMDIHISKNGNKLTAIPGTWFGELVVREDPPRPL
jgi:hypothetical protein